MLSPKFGVFLLIGLCLASPAFALDLLSPAKREIAMQLVSSAENSSLDWRKQYAYIEDIDDDRGYTAGLIGFTSANDDMLDVVERYTSKRAANPLAKYLPALKKLAEEESSAHTGLDPDFVDAWRRAAKDPAFREAQDEILTEQYLEPAVEQAKDDGLSTLGQFIYHDALVMHGPGDQREAFGGIRAAAKKVAQTPSQGGNEKAWLNAFLDARVTIMREEKAHEDTSRVELEQRRFLREGNYSLSPPLRWRTNDEDFVIEH
ncbi:chitosanase [Enterobacter sp. Ap-1006]|uniref:chitosanase n=1 Tax=Enterobacter sp. Ap-1006 TaxID=2608345 RepID=UPI001421AA00|nr:chitosanase [Enterobacter sp. Ap-1006]NIF47259.1 chitosanase [Enterobacter sp. Ap-1006]